MKLGVQMTPAPLPPAFEHYVNMHGVLDFAVFDDAQGTAEEQVSAIGSLMSKGDFNAEALRRLGNRIIDEATFFGDWFNPTNGRLIKCGSWDVSPETPYMSDWRQRTNVVEGSKDFPARDASAKQRWRIENPELLTLEGLKLHGGGAPIPNAGAGGQFAYAFMAPPYSLRGTPNEVQSAFDQIREFILPAGETAVIRDWCSSDLVQVSDYFIPGLEWWGAFLFTIHIPATGRLSAIAGSTSD
jgi:hypothetical protein